MLKLTLGALAVLAPAAAMAEPTLPSDYDNFKIYYIEQHQLESPTFRKCLKNAEKSQRPKTTVILEEAMPTPMQSKCMETETTRLRRDMQLYVEFTMSKARLQAGLSEKWATKEVPLSDRPEYKVQQAQEKWQLAQAAWSDALPQQCTKNFGAKTDDLKATASFFQSCILTETTRRMVWVLRTL